jgi:tRNA(fMet)-specific endonuclease VapC
VNYLLDTDTWSYFMAKQPTVVAKVAAAGVLSVFYCDVSLAELYYGALLKRTQSQAKGDELLRRIEAIGQWFPRVALTPDVARAFGEIKTDLRVRGLLIEDFDILIAAHALTHRCTLVTNNVRHFQRISGLVIENWMTSFPP